MKDFRGVDRSSSSVAPILRLSYRVAAVAIVAGCSDGLKTGFFRWVDRNFDIVASAMMVYSYYLVDHAVFLYQVSLLGRMVNEDNRLSIDFNSISLLPSTRERYYILIEAQHHHPSHDRHETGWRMNAKFICLYE